MAAFLKCRHNIRLEEQRRQEEDEEED